MQWYYAKGNEQVGPVADEDFKALVRDGSVGPDTLVWREGMEEWIAYRMVSTGSPSFIRPKTQLRVATPANATCSQCGQSFPAATLQQRDGAAVCQSCAGAEPASREFMRYGGFWIRFLAKIIDGMILGAVCTAIAIAYMFVRLGGFNLQDPAALLATLTQLNLAMVVLQIVYVTFFVGKFGGTPGKLALGLRIVRDNGAAVSYGRAFGRYFAEILSGLLLYIGYIMAAFDSEKRALHDRICDTRVVYK